MKVLISTLNLASCLYYVAHHVDSYEVCHFCIHLFAFKQLKR
jgi:hypothetical protein